MLGLLAKRLDTYRLKSKKVISSQQYTKKVFEAAKTLETQRQSSLIASLCYIGDRTELQNYLNRISNHKRAKEEEMAVMGSVGMFEQVLDLLEQDTAKLSARRVKMYYAISLG